MGRGLFQYALQQIWGELDIGTPAGDAIPWHEQVLALCAEYEKDPAAVTHYDAQCQLRIKGLMSYQYLLWAVDRKHDAPPAWVPWMCSGPDSIS